MSEHLQRRLGLGGAMATNLLSMIGIGPFLTIPGMVALQGGPHLLYAWLLGGVLALCDGLVYAHFAAALPGAGGPYLYLREAFAPLKLGRPLSFLFIFQTLLVQPLSIAAAAVGFADYLGSYASLTPALHHAIAAGLIVALTALCYRPIESAGKLSMIMLGVVGLTVGWVIVAGLIHFSPAQAFAWPPQATTFDKDFFVRVGPVALLAMYNYGGYNTACYLGEEIRDPARTMPRAIVLSILSVIVLYVVLSTVILGTIPWTEVATSKTIATTFIARTFSDPSAGHIASIGITAMILFVTASALYASILAVSRIPFAAARDGQFFAAFAKVHPTGGFPHVSLIVLGLSALPFCFVSFARLVSWLMQVQIVVQFLWQCAGVILIRRRKDIAQPFVMWLFPIPALVAFALWAYVLVTSDPWGILFSLGFLVAGLVAYAAFVRRAR